SLSRRPPPPTLFPYTRSSDLPGAAAHPRSPAHEDKALRRSRPHRTAAGSTPPGVPLHHGHAVPQSASSGAPSRGQDIERSRLTRSEEHTSELQSRENLVCRLL